MEGEGNGGVSGSLGIVGNVALAGGDVTAPRGTSTIEASLLRLTTPRLHVTFTSCFSHRCLLHGAIWVFRKY